jgi:hypothetical protein
MPDPSWGGGGAVWGTLMAPAWGGGGVSKVMGINDMTRVGEGAVLTFVSKERLTVIVRFLPTSKYHTNINKKQRIFTVFMRHQNYLFLSTSAQLLYLFHKK